jgi:sulfur carrier protein ThiS
LKIYVEYKGFFDARKIEQAPVIEMPEGSTIDDLYRKIGFKEGDIGHIQSFLNKDASWKSSKLKNNDQVTIVWILTGG